MIPDSDVINQLPFNLRLDLGGAQKKAAQKKGGKKQKKK
jgi:hypothetical protein